MLRHVEDLYSVYGDQLREGRLPSLVEYATLPTSAGLVASKLPRRAYDDIYSAVRHYYGVPVASKLLSKDPRECKAARKEDASWCSRLRHSYLWYFRLSLDGRVVYRCEDVPTSRVHGTTSNDDMLQLREDYTLLSALQPASEYAVVAEDEGVYVYEGTVTLYTAEWDKAAVDRLVYLGYVVGPFAYAARREAEYQQLRRAS
jgi:hypothetical protein